MRNDYPTGDVARSRGARRLSLSGAYGELSRGHNYFPDAREDGETAVTRYVTYMGRIRRELSQAVRDRGVERTWAVIEEGRAAGLAGKHLNDYLFYAGRVRLGYPQPAFPAFLPMLTTELLLATFLAPPDEKLDNRAIREATVRLAPFWRDVPYERELGKDRPPREVNKSQVQPTFWEVDRDQFFDTVTRALGDLPQLELTVPVVEKMTVEQREGRARTNQTMEFILWHRGARLVMEELGALQAAHPYG